MIISASRRTDIPAFYARWFVNRIRAGFCDVVNPFNSHQVSRVSLAPDDVDAIVFWTRDPRPLMPHLAELDERRYRYYVQFTLTGYPALLEPHLPDAERLLGAFAALSERIGPERVIWRYDPILLSDHTPPSFHVDRFGELAGALVGMTRHAVISLFDPYRKAQARLRRAGIEPIFGDALGGAGVEGMLAAMAETAVAGRMEIQSCAEESDWSHLGITPGACIDAELIRRVWGVEVDGGKDPSQRPACRCAPSKDIGAYDTCRHGCLYCYAVTGRIGANARHDPDGPALLTLRG